VSHDEAKCQEVSFVYPLFGTFFYCAFHHLQQWLTTENGTEAKIPGATDMHGLAKTIELLAENTTTGIIARERDANLTMVYVLSYSSSSGAC
jgi:hypothetical protein